MSSEPMAWWYWFGMWVFGGAGLVITWWMLLDAWRRQGSAARFAWPGAAIIGLTLQIPAFASADGGQMAAALGVAGAILLGVAAVSYFTRGAGSTGSTWSVRTRDSGSASSAARDRKIPQRPARAAIPIVGPDVGVNNPATSPSTNPPVSNATTQPLGSPNINLRKSTDVLSLDAMEPRSSQRQTSVTSPEAQSGAVSVGQAEVAEHIVPSQMPLTIDDAVEPTLTDKNERTAAERLDDTIVGEPLATVVDESVKAVAAELAVTGGRTTQIIVTGRSGPFLVGRDPSRCNLAIDDGRASRVHFSIQLVDGTYIIEDLGSSNGTFLNGAMLRESALLSDGDVIEFGRTVAIFHLNQREGT